MHTPSRRQSVRLLARLRAMGVDLPEDTTLKRTYAPRSALSNGAWTWVAYDAGGIPMPLGGYCRMSDLLAMPRLAAYRDRATGDVTIDEFGSPGAEHGERACVPLG